MKRSNFFALTAVACLSFVIGCSSSGGDATSAYSANSPSGVIGVVGQAVAAAGSGLSSTSITLQEKNRASFTSANCDAHGDPKVSGASIGSSNTAYPGTLTYCKMTVNDYSPDTIQGAFALPKGISCAVERAGITFDGAPHELTVSIDSNCFTAAQITSMGVTSLTATVTGSKPAAFNTYFDSGVRIVSSAAGIDYSLGTKITSSSVEFVSYEVGTANEKGAFAGSLNLTNGQLRYEGRMERINCSTSGRCGWNRHIRVFADLTVVNNLPGSLESIAFGYANIQSPPGQSGYGGVVVTATGNLTTGIKARAWNATDGAAGTPTAVAQYDTVGNWTETSNTNCYTSSSDSASTCGAGIGLFSSNAYFVLNHASHTSTTAFVNNYAGMTWETVDINTDVQ